MTYIELKGVNFKIGNRFLFKEDVNLFVKTKHIVFLVGSSGSGKTTLWKISAYLTEPSKGKVLWNGEEIKNLEQANRLRSKFISLYPSKYIFFEELTAEENINIVGKLLNVNVKEKVEELNETFERVSNKDLRFSDLRKKSVKVLSGGQKEIVALYRALLSDAPILLADELFRSTDAKSTEELWNFLQQYLCKKNMGMLFITHKRELISHLDKSLLKNHGFSYRAFEINNGLVKPIDDLK